MEHSEVKPSFLHALFCMAMTIFIVFFGLFVIDADMHAVMLIAILWMMVNVLYLDNDTNRFKQSLLSAIQKTSSVLFIYILIGTVMGAFIISGAIPTLIYYGLKMITPRFFLPMGMLLCSMTSLTLGSCWATIGTMGIACMGLASAFHIPLPIAAGMVVSGAYFGDKLSPISDTTLLSATVTNTPLYRHIHGMVYSLVPAYLCCLFIFMMIGLQYVDITSTNTQTIQDVTTYLQTHYHVGVVTLIPMLVMFVLITSRKPAEMAMLIGIFLALVVAIFVQHFDVKTALNALYHPIHNATKQPLLDNLLSRGGMSQMLDSLSLTLLILALGGLIEFYHFITVLFTKSIEKIRGPLALVVATLGTSVLSNMLVSEAYLSIILVNKIFSKAYQRHRLHSCLLSKSIEEGTTFSTPLIPWSTSGIFITSTLGISPREYLMWSILNWLAPLFFIVFVSCRFFGKKMYYAASHHDLVNAFPQTQITTHLPEDLEEKLSKIITYRLGSLPESNMITTKVLMHLAPQAAYQFFPGKLVPYQKKNANKAPPLQNVVPQQPKLIEIVGQWTSDTSVSSKEANILGLSGSLYVNCDRLQFEVETPTAEKLAYYNARLLTVGDSIFMDTQENLPLSVVRVGKNYQHGYLKLPEFGGGYYLEVHDTPHLWSHFTPNGSGVLLLGKKIRDDVYHLSAFSLPYGQAIYIPGGVIHCDGLLIGDIMVIYTVTPHFSTVIIKNTDKKLCEVEV